MSASILQTVYPVGSMFATISNLTPSQLLGFGQWEQIESAYLRAVTDNSAGTYFGSDTHAHVIMGTTLSANQIPEHTHSVNAETSTSGSHSHTASSQCTYSGTHSHELDLSTTGGGVHTHQTVARTWYTKSGQGEIKILGAYWESEYPEVDDPSVRVEADGYHTHYLTGTTEQEGSHTHVVGTIIADNGSHNHSLSATTQVNQTLGLPHTHLMSQSSSLMKSYGIHIYIRVS